MDLSQLGLDTTTGTTQSIDIQGIMGTVTIISVVIGGLFLIIYLINLIQHMRVNRAMLAMHKDVAEIRKLMEERRPAMPAPVIVKGDPIIRDESESSSANVEHTS